MADLPELELIDLSSQRTLASRTFDSLSRLYVESVLKVAIYSCRGGRIKSQYQPVGGVLKRLSNSAALLNSLGVLDDSSIEIDPVSADDLRVRVPVGSIDSFLSWYESGEGRESEPWREFFEELVRPGVDGSPSILGDSAGVFPHVAFQWVGRHVEDLHYTPHFRCHEVLIAEIFEVALLPEQQLAFSSLQTRGGDSRVVWATSDEIVRGKAGDKALAETCKWLLDFPSAQLTV